MVTPTLSVTQDGLITVDLVNLIPNSFNNAQVFCQKTGSTDPIQILWSASYNNQNAFPANVQIPNLEPNTSYDISFGGILAWDETIFQTSSWMIGTTLVSGSSTPVVNLLAQQAAKHKKK